MDIVKQIETTQVTASTSTYIKERFRTLKSGHLFMAETQTHGRGQRANTWHSGPGLNLTFSFYVKTPRQVGTPLLTMTGVALIKTLANYGITASLKLPNDVIVNHRKIAGILIENIIDNDIEHVIVGVGLNVNEIMPDTMVETSISMRMVTGKSYDLPSVLHTFTAYLNRLNPNNAFAIFKAHVLKNNHIVHWKGKTGILKDFDDKFVCEVDIESLTEFVPCGMLTFSTK